jgi:hypothetical protein
MSADRTSGRVYGTGLGEGHHAANLVLELSHVTGQPKSAESLHGFFGHPDVAFPNSSAARMRKRLMSVGIRLFVREAV